MAQCMFPYYVERKLYLSQTDRLVPVPCGKCPECLKRRNNDWTFRLQQEAKLHTSQYFVTLTYSPEECPISDNGFMTLNKKHVQDFLKRLRKNTGSYIRYYMCGEYGTQYQRPHYHLIIFSDDRCNDTDIVRAWVNPKTGFVFGHVHFGRVEPASIQYTVQYYDKGDWYPAHSRDDREPEFSLMSKGLGKNFLNEETVRFIVQRPAEQYIYDGGVRRAIPRYYKRRIFEYRGTQSIVEQHPAFVAHVHDMDAERRKRNLITKKIQDEKEQPDPADRTVHEDRAAAIRNYRASKRKTRD